MMKTQDLKERAYHLMGQFDQSADFGYYMQHFYAQHLDWFDWKEQAEILTLIAN